MILVGKLETYRCAQVAYRLTHHTVRFRYSTGRCNSANIKRAEYFFLRYVLPIEQVQEHKYF